MLNLAEEEKVCRESLLLSRTTGNEALVASTTYNLGLSLLSQNRPEEARPFFTESLTLKQHIGDRAGEISRLCMLSNLTVLQRNFTQAQLYLSEATAVNTDLEAPNRTIQRLSAEGFCYMMQDNWPEAIVNWQKLIDIAQTQNNDWAITVTQFYLSWAYIAANLQDQAKHLLLDGLKNIKTRKIVRNYPLALLTQINYLYAVGEVQQSASLLHYYLQEPRPLTVLEISQLESLKEKIQGHGNEGWGERGVQAPSGSLFDVVDRLVIA